METYFLFLLLNFVFATVSVVVFWFVSDKNKDIISDKMGSVLDEVTLRIKESKHEIIDSGDNSSQHNLSIFKTLEESGESRFNEVREEIQKTKQEIIEIKELSKKTAEQHEEYHDGMLEKLNHAGELIVGYETFFENSLSELDELFRFIDILSKRPAVSSDPDFTSFVRAVQAMTQVISKYSSVAEEIKRGVK